jgi:hypothetical protein
MNVDIWQRWTVGMVTTRGVVAQMLTSDMGQSLQGVCHWAGPGVRFGPKTDLIHKRNPVALKYPGRADTLCPPSHRRFVPRTDSRTAANRIVMQSPVVGGEQRVRNGNADRTGSVEVDAQFGFSSE